MALAHLEIVGVVGGGDFDAARAEFRINKFIANDGNLSPQNRQGEHFPDQVLIAFVLGTHGHGGIAQHRFGAGGGHFHGAAAIAEGIAEMPEVAVYFFGFNFEVGNGGLRRGTPVDEVVTAIDQPVFVEFDEGREDGFAEGVVHGEAFAAPVGGEAEATQLIHDRTSRLRSPIPRPF